MSRWLWMRRTNIVASVILFAIAVTAFVATADLPAPGRPNDPGAAGYPRLLAVLIGVLALALVGQKDDSEPLPRGRDGLRVIGLFVLLLVYVNLLAGLGYMAATFVFLVAALLLAGVRQPIPLVGIPVLMAGGIYFVFHELFRVSLPRGLLERLMS